MVCVADSVPAVPLTVTVVGGLCGAVGADTSFSAALAANRDAHGPGRYASGQLLSGQLHGLGKAIGPLHVDGDGGLIACQTMALLAGTLR